MFSRDIHYGRPTVKGALYTFNLVLKEAKKEHVSIFEVIVGYGSVSGSHKIKNAVISQLEECLLKGQIKEYIVGNEIDIFNPKYQNFKNKHLLPECEKDKKNSGAIFISLK